MSMHTGSYVAAITPAFTQISFLLLLLMTTISVTGALRSTADKSSLTFHCDMGCNAATKSSNARFMALPFCYIVIALMLRKGHRMLELAIFERIRADMIETGAGIDHERYRTTLTTSGMLRASLDWMNTGLVAWGTIRSWRYVS